jgi:hypothetical protein
MTFSSGHDSNLLIFCWLEVHEVLDFHTEISYFSPFLIFVDNGILWIKQQK